MNFGVCVTPENSKEGAYQNLPELEKHDFLFYYANLFHEILLLPLNSESYLQRNQVHASVELTLYLPSPQTREPSGLGQFVILWNSKAEDKTNPKIPSILEKIHTQVFTLNEKSLPAVKHYLSYQIKSYPP